MYKRLWPVLIMMAILITGVNDGQGAQSTLTEAEGYSCLGVDKSKRDTEKEARAEAKRNAVENAKTFIKSETKVQDFQLLKDIVEAYSQADVKVLEEMQARWYRDDASGDCFRVRIRAEVVPNERTMAAIDKGSAAADDPLAPLHVKLWTDKKSYQKGDKIRIYLKGNRPFYARVLHRGVRGEILQLLPNPFRTDNYFAGGSIFEIPAGNDRFEMIVSPPFGEESIVLQASTLPLGELNLQNAGSVYQVTTGAKEMAVKSRGIALQAAAGEAAPQRAVFVEEKLKFQTKQ